MPLPSYDPTTEVVGYLDVYDRDHVLAPGVRFEFQLMATIGTAGRSFPAGSTSSRKEVSPSDGHLQVVVLASAQYQVRREVTAGQWGGWVSFTTPVVGSPTFPINEVLGRAG